MQFVFQGFVIHVFINCPLHIITSRLKVSPCERKICIGSRKKVQVEKDLILWKVTPFSARTIFPATDMLHTWQIYLWKGDSIWERMGLSNILLERKNWCLKILLNNNCICLAYPIYPHLIKILCLLSLFLLSYIHHRWDTKFQFAASWFWTKKIAPKQWDSIARHFRLKRRNLQVFWQFVFHLF